MFIAYQVIVKNAAGALKAIGFFSFFHRMFDKCKSFISLNKAEEYGSTDDDDEADIDLDIYALKNKPQDEFTEKSGNIELVPSRDPISTSSFDSEATDAVKEKNGLGTTI